jgi:hypothetical protein
MIGWLRRFFGKKGPSRGDGRLHGTWRVGDLAVSLTSDWHPHDPRLGPPHVYPVAGDVWRVTSVGLELGFHILRFQEGDGLWFTAKSFRKAVTSEDEACEPEFVSLLRKSKRRVGA